jgi:hypothetical protein
MAMTAAGRHILVPFCRAIDGHKLGALLQLVDAPSTSGQS